MIGKRSAEAAPEADASHLYGGYGLGLATIGYPAAYGYASYGYPAWGGYGAHLIGKRSAEAEPSFGYGYGLGGYGGYAGYGGHYGGYGYGRGLYGYYG